ncbi:MAG: FAD:protein FMN transferase [Alphaproteobacteria bacterium]|nr:FAD:protein FMN transferase [Alphaproteobacteria bacterium]
MRIFHYISILLFMLAVGIFIYQYSPHYQIIKGDIFGTYYNVKIKTDNKNNELKGKIKEKLQEINSIMSIFEPTSEISKINQTEARQKIELSVSMREVIKTADKVYWQSQGYFDPTLGQLIDLWGFGSAKSVNPSADEVKQALRSAGFNKLKFSKDFQYITKTNSQTKLNLSAIAKGWATDEIAKLLDSEGYNNYIVEIGGEIKTKGYREQEEPWSIGINRPLSGATDNIMVVSLSNMAVATSGNYRNFYSADGKVLGHTISYKTGEPVETDVASVSVFHPSCMMADAYATAIVAMGVAKGLEFANHQKLKVIIFDNEFNQHLSQSAQKMFR